MINRSATPLEKLITISNLHPAKIAPKYLADDKKRMESRQKHTIDEEWENKNGKQKLIVQVIKVPLIDKTTGDVIGTMGLFWDRTE